MVLLLGCWWFISFESIDFNFWFYSFDDDVKINLVLDLFLICCHRWIGSGWFPVLFVVVVRIDRGIAFVLGWFRLLLCSFPSVFIIFLVGCIVH